MNKNEQFEVTFRNAISEWLALEAEGNPLALNYRKQYRKMIDLGQVSTVTIIKSISTLLDNDSISYQDKYKLVILIIEIDPKSQFSEYFWLITKSNIVCEFTDLTQAGTVCNLMLKLSNARTVRSYLCYKLITENESSYKSILMAFYPVGHNVDTIKVAQQVIPAPNQDNLELYYLLYLDANWYLTDEIIKGLSEADKYFYREFFDKGVGLGNLNITSICQAALNRLEKQKEF